MALAVAAEANSEPAAAVNTPASHPSASLESTAGYPPPHLVADSQVLWHKFLVAQVPGSLRRMAFFLSVYMRT